MFVAVGAVLLKERSENRRQQALDLKRRALYAAEARRRYESWKQEQERELEAIAAGLSDKLGF